MPHITKIYGPPGTGKTTFMLKTLEDEIRRGTPLIKIAYLTFSVAAKQEAVNRAKLLISAADENFQYFKTIHGICHREARMSGPVVMITEDFLDFGNEYGIKFSEDYTDINDFDGMPIGWGSSIGNKILNIRQVASARCIDPMSDICKRKDWPQDISQSMVSYVLKSYDEYKEKRSKFDFVDMLHMYRDAGEPLNIDVMFIDEAQDLSKLQWRLVEKMFANAQRVYIAGDDDQSIYGFLGADPLGFYNYPCSEKKYLTRSYRLKSNIYNYAYRIISKVKDREEKQVVVDAEGGTIEHWNRGIDEIIPTVDPKQDTMVISQTNHQLISIASRFERLGTPITYKGYALTGSPHALIVQAYFYLRSGKSIPIKIGAAMLKLLKLQTAKSLAEEARTDPDLVVGRELMENLGVNFEVSNWIEYLSNGRRHIGTNEKLLAVARAWGIDSISKPPTIELTTYHASKGREASTVILSTDCSPASYEYATNDPDTERRVAYVGVTRAKNKLIINAAQTSEEMRAFRA